MGTPAASEDRCQQFYDLPNLGHRFVGVVPNADASAQRILGLGSDRSFAVSIREMYPALMSAREASARTVSPADVRRARTLTASR